MKINVAEADNALKNKPLYSTAYERIKYLAEARHLFDDLPQPLKFSRTLRYLLSRVSVPVKEYDIIIGRACDKVLSESEEALFKEFVADPSNAYRSGVFFGSGHSSYDWEDIVDLGLSGLKSRAISRLSGETDNEKIVFLTAVIEVYDCISEYILRYADSCEKAGLTDAAKVLRKISAEKPDTFYEAVELTYIIAFINCSYVTLNPTLTLGRIDVFLYPFYERDIKRGILTKERAKDIITDYYCKHNLNMGRGEHQLGDENDSTTFERITNFDAPQYLLLAGTDKNGESAVNELTELFAECIVPSFKNPVVLVRYFIGMNEKHPSLLKTLVNKTLKSSSLMFYNDNDVIAALMRMGLKEDAREYIHFGCNWSSPGTKGAWMHGGPSSFAFCPEMSEDEKTYFYLRRPYMRTLNDGGWPECFNEILFSFAESSDESCCIEWFFDAYMKKWSEFVSEKLEYLSCELKMRRRHPSRLLVYTDCFLKDSINLAECYAASAKYHFEAQSFYMFATVVDCFLAVDELVFTKKLVTLKELAEAVKNNFEGNERLRQMCVSAEKYGSDGEKSNAFAKRLITAATDIVFEQSKPYFEKYGLYLAPSLQSDTWHIKCGREYGATPDGRKAGQPFSQNSRPSNGSCINGLTGMLDSMLSVPAGSVMSGALNLDVDKKAFAGEEGNKNFADLLAAYFNAGGLHAQVSCVSKEDLVAAQKNPEAYKDLRVRVTGYSGIFVDFCKSLQDDIIARF